MVEPPTKFSKRGDLTGPPFVEGVAGKEEGDFFSGAVGGGVGWGVEIFQKK